MRRRCHADSDSWHAQGARRALARIFETDPHNGHAWAVLGQMDEAAGDFDAALECFRRGTEDPGAVQSVMSLPSIALSDGRPSVMLRPFAVQLSVWRQLQTGMRICPYICAETVPCTGTACMACTLCQPALHGPCARYAGAPGALRSFEGLALMQAFRGNPGLARATFQQVTCSSHTGLAQALLLGNVTQIHIIGHNQRLGLTPMCPSRALQRISPLRVSFAAGRSSKSVRAALR